jgi:putative tricarboxylic transport membrane protein
VREVHLYITLFWMALGIFVAAYSYWLGLGKLLDPGPGLFPFLLGLAVLLLGVYKLTKEFPLAKKDEEESREKEKGSFFDNAGRIVVFATVLLAYTFLLEPLGFLMTTFLGMVMLLRIAGYTQWVRIIVYAVIISVISYTGFTYLGTRLPPGILDLGLH